VTTDSSSASADDLWHQARSRLWGHARELSERRRPARSQPPCARQKGENKGENGYEKDELGCATDAWGRHNGGCAVGNRWVVCGDEGIGCVDRPFQGAGDQPCGKTGGHDPGGNVGGNQTG